MILQDLDPYGFVEFRNALAETQGLTQQFVLDQYPDELLHTLRAEGEAAGYPVLPQIFATCRWCGSDTHLTTSEVETMTALLNTIWYVELHGPGGPSFCRRAGVTNAQIRLVEEDVDRIGLMCRDRCMFVGTEGDQ